MNFDIYPLILPSYYLYAFYIQKPKLKILANLFIIAVIFTFSQINPNYRDILLPFIAFLIYFITTFWQERKVSSSVILASFPMINLFIANKWMFSLSFSALWMTLVVTLAFISANNYLINRLIIYLQQLWKGSQNILYLVYLFLFFLLYYQQILQTLNYFLLFNDSWILLLRIVYIFFVGLFIAMLVAFEHSNRQISDIEQAKAQTEISKQYIQQISQQYDEVRLFRHDYQNILLSLEGLAKAEEWESLRDYLKQAMDSFESDSQKMNRQLAKLVYIQNADIRHLIYTKMVHAESLGLSYTIEIDHNIIIENPDSHLLARMLGIILDNAIEEASQVIEGGLSLAMSGEEEVSVIVANRCRSISSPLSILKQKDYSTKGENRGLGLWSLDNLITSSNILLNTEIRDSYFLQELIIPKEDV